MSRTRNSPDADSSPEDSYTEQDHPLRIHPAAHTITLLQVPPRAADGEKRSLSLASSITGSDVPILKVNETYRSVQSSQWTCTLVLAILASAAGSGFPHGYNTGVINAPQLKICDWLKNVLSDDHFKDDNKETKHLVTLIWSIIVSIMCVGGIVGGIASGYMISSFGPRTSLLLNNVILVMAVLLEGFAKSANSYIMLIAGRLITGINSGLSSGICPLYLSVISPTDIRGATASAYQFFVTCGILTSQIIATDSVLGTEKRWPYLFWLLLTVSTFQIFTLSFCPESPMYLYAEGKEDSAYNALARLRQSDDFNEEYRMLKEKSDEKKQMAVISVRDIFRSRFYRKPVIVIVVVMIAQQFSGINAIMYFSTAIFRLSGLDDDQSQLATILMGLVNVLMTVVSVLIVDMTGRKVLLLIGFAGMFLCSILLTVALNFASETILISYCCIGLVLLFVIFFAAGTGSIPWFLVSELFHPNAIPVATSIGICVNWTANFVVGLCFLPLKDMLDTYVFVVFAVLQLIFFLFIWRRVPETKNRTLDDIYAEFRRHIYGV